MATSRSTTRERWKSAAGLAVAVMVILTLLTAVVVPATGARYAADLPSSPVATPTGGRLAASLGLIGKIEPAQVTYLVTWPEDRLVRLRKWLDHGIEFEGAWASEELDLVVTILDAFGTAYGEARFAQLAAAAATTGSGGRQDHLRLVRDPGSTMPAAFWRAHEGEIHFLQGVFDAAWFAEHYHWTFWEGSYAHPGPEVTLRHVVIAHEFGHVLIDGLRIEVVAAGHDSLALETLYGERIEPSQWPHLGYELNESLATELALWALEVERTEGVNALRAELGRYLSPVTESGIRP